MAPSGHTIATITANDLDSGRFGSDGIRYSLTGAGAELFHVNEETGAITVAECPIKQTRNKRDIVEPTNKPKNVNLTIVGRTGVIDIDEIETTTTEIYFPTTQEDLTSRPYTYIDDDYEILSPEDEEHTITSPDIIDKMAKEYVQFARNKAKKGSSSLEGQNLEYGKNYRSKDQQLSGDWAPTENNIYHEFRPTITDDLLTKSWTTERSTLRPPEMGSGHAPCLDYETQSVYFLSYKVGLLQ